MDGLSNQQTAAELLQQLGLKEYEAKAFVALSRLPRGTARDVSEISEVPRTRVYDAIRVLESKGLVEVQHSSPQQFRAIGVEEAVDILRTEYEDRTAALREALGNVEPASTEEETDVTHEVWSLSGVSAIENRTRQLVREASGEVVLVVGDEDVLTDALVQALEGARDSGVSLVLGTLNDSVQDRVQSRFPDAEVFVSGLEWLRADLPDDDTDISRLLLVDRSAILVSTRHRVGDGSEHAVFGRGFGNGLVTIARRLMSTGLLPAEDPGLSEDRVR